MSTSAQTIAHLLDLLQGQAALTARRMFGEYALYLDGKTVAFVCDDQLFLKPLPQAMALLPGREMAPAYPGSKLYILVTEDLDDPDLVGRALRAIAEATPPAKARTPRNPRPPPRTPKVK